MSRCIRCGTVIKHGTTRWYRIFTVEYCENSHNLSASERALGD
jgi:hypothetical protein